jgi:hypothetical protein
VEPKEYKKEERGSSKEKADNRKHNIRFMNESRYFSNDDISRLNSSVKHSVLLGN